MGTDIRTYASTEKSFINAKDDFYSLLTATYNRATRGDITVVIGDLNAKVGADRTTLEHVLSNQGIGIRNYNGERFVDFCNTNHLVIGGTVFQHKPCHKISWVSPNGRDQNQIDHFAITRRFRGCLQDIRNKRGAVIGFAHDHHLIIATFRLRTAVGKKCDVEARRDRLKCPTFLTNFSKKIVHHATCLATSQSVSLAQKWVAVKAM